MELTVGQWLKQRRNTLDLTQQELANKIGCARSTIRKLENNSRRPSKQMARLLGEHLEIPTVQLADFVTLLRAHLRATSIEITAFADSLPPQQGTAASFTRQSHKMVANAHDVPSQSLAMVGREVETELLARQLLHEPYLRLITILGPGGIGKTRLALAAVERISSQATRRFRHGIFFVSLAGVESVRVLPRAIAEGLGYRATRENLETQLLSYLSNKALILVLDNFEHLLAGVDLLNNILRAAPQVKILVTSRARLKQQAEQILSLQGLTYPQSNRASANELEGYSALKLFMQNARRVKPSFEINTTNQRYVLEICRFMQGSPLGIMLATSWLASLTPRAITREMKHNIDFLETQAVDVPLRQRSLRAALEHSWRLLTVKEQLIFVQMSVFRGGFRRKAAQTLTGANVKDMQSLCNHSLVSLGPEGRYEMHELLRQFAAGKLAESPVRQSDARDRHSSHYCLLLDQLTHDWYSDRQANALASVTAEADNIQRALRIALENGEWKRLFGAIFSWGHFHQLKEFRTDGEAFCRELIERIKVPDQTAQDAAKEAMWLLAKAWNWYGVFADSNTIAIERFDNCKSTLSKLSDSGFDIRWEHAFVNLNMAKRLNDVDRNRERVVVEESLVLFQELDETWGVANCLCLLGHRAWGVGDYPEAFNLLSRALLLTDQMGNRIQKIEVLETIFWLHMHQGRLAKAEAVAREAIESSREMGILTDQKLSSFPYILSWQGSYEEGIAAGSRNLASCRKDASSNLLGYIHLSIGCPALYSGKVDLARTHLNSALTKIRDGGGYGVEASILADLGNLALATGEFERAQAYFEESIRLYRIVSDNYIGKGLAGATLAACCRGDWQQARDTLLESLTTGLEIGDFLFLLFGLPGMACYFAGSGEERFAMTVWAHAQTHGFIANGKLFHNVVEPMIEAARDTLPAKTICEAETQGRTMDIWEVSNLAQGIVNLTVK